MYPHLIHTNAARERLANIVQTSHKPTVSRSVRLDRYLATSLLQKSIRRDEPELAWIAAVYLYEHQQAYLWRRLPIIALEDIGIGDLRLVMSVIIAASEPRLREQLGNGHQVLSALIGAMCAAPKDRQPDDLFDVISRDPNLIGARATLSELQINQILAWSSEENLGVTNVAVQLAVLAGCAGEIPCNQLHKVRWRDAMNMIDCSPLPPLTHEAALLGLQRTGSALAPMLFATGMAPDTREGVVDDDFPAPLPPSDFPVWAAGVHTRAGLAGFRKYVSQSKCMAALLKHASGGVSKSKIVGELVFRLDCGQLRHRVQSKQGESLKARATHLGFGIPDEVVLEALEILQAEYVMLNDCRAIALKEYFG